MFPKQICKRILPDTGESRSDKTFFLKTNMEMVARVFMHCPLDSRASLNHGSLWFPPLFYSFFDLSARGEPTHHRATSASNHAQPESGHGQNKGHRECPVKAGAGMPKNNLTDQKKAEVVEKKEAALQTTGDYKQVFSGPTVHRLNTKKRKGQRLFTDILAGFTFNNRVLRFPAIVLLTRRFDPETRAFFGYTSKLSNRPIYTFMLLCLGVATYRAKIVLKKC